MCIECETLRRVSYVLRLVQRSGKAKQSQLTLQQVQLHCCNQESGTGQPPRRVVTGTSMAVGDRKSTRLNSSHLVISYAVFCLKKKKETTWKVSSSRSRSISSHPAG